MFFPEAQFLMLTESSDELWAGVDVGTTTLN